jgi:hypothetical protein
VQEDVAVFLVNGACNIESDPMLKFFIESWCYSIKCQREIAGAKRAHEFVACSGQE